MDCFGLCSRCRYINYDLEERELHERNRAIDKQINRERRQMRQEVKLLLLGAGESGKSTFVKQMQIIHGHNFESEHLMEYRQIIYSNTVKGMKVLIDALRKLHIPWQTVTSIPLAEHVFRYQNQPLDPMLFNHYSIAIALLWEDEGIREAHERRAEFQISDGVRYFFDNIARISDVNYVPTHQDILYARKATKGITEYTAVVNKVPFTFVDVGGQRSQRQKWFQCFDNVTSILFLVSTSEYDQVLIEDRETNRLTESKLIFDNIVNHRAFTDVSMILFLNKTDLLIEKLQRLRRSRGVQSISGKQIEIRITAPDQQTKLWRGSAEPPISVSDLPPRLLTIGDIFPEFTGDPFELKSVQEFILEMFDQTRRDRRKMMYHHFTTAVDTENIKYVFNAVRSTILQKNITALMLQ